MSQKIRSRARGVGEAAAYHNEEGGRISHYDKGPPGRSRHLSRGRLVIHALSKRWATLFGLFKFQRPIIDQSLNQEDHRGNHLQGRKLLILWDNPGWHRGSMVTDYIKRDGKLEVICFPKYAPEENPQEHVWKEGRAKVAHNTFIGNLTQTAKDFVSYLNSTRFHYSLLGFTSSPV